MTKRDKRERVLFGWCMTGDSERCPGVTLGSRGRLIFCAGIAHEGQEFTACLTCKDTDTELIPITEEVTWEGSTKTVTYTGLTCVDVEGCIMRAQERSDAALERLAKRVGPGILRRPRVSTEATGKAATGHGTARSERRPAPPMVDSIKGWCQCGCGEHTNSPTSRFRQGHDQRLKGVLLRSNDPEALAERIARGWASEEGASAPVRMMASDADFLTRRIEERLGIERLPIEESKRRKAARKGKTS